MNGVLRVWMACPVPWKNICDRTCIPSRAFVVSYLAATEIGRTCPMTEGYKTNHIIHITQK